MENTLVSNDYHNYWFKTDICHYWNTIYSIVTTKSINNIKIDTSNFWGINVKTDNHKL